MKGKIEPMDFDNIKSQLKDEVNSAFTIWLDLLENFFGDNLAYTYAKGSAIKKWNGPIDYVPIISDIDIHYGVHNKKILFTSDNPRETSLKVSLEYEKRFLRENPNFIHIPRTQVMCIDLLQDAVNFVHPLVDSIKMLFGEFPSHNHVASENIKEIDINNLAELKPYLDMLPESWIDKVGMDYWSSLRRLTWKVSPTPVRILSQLLPDPLNIWTWNRSQIKQELENQNLNNIANMYERYYMNGWKLFESNITSTEYFQKCLLSGSKVLELCYNWYIHYITNSRKY